MDNRKLMSLLNLFNSVEEITMILKGYNFANWDIFTTMILKIIKKFKKLIKINIKCIKQSRKAAVQRQICFTCGFDPETVDAAFQRKENAADFFTNYFAKIVDTAVKSNEKTRIGCLIKQIKVEFFWLSNPTEEPLVFENNTSLSRLCDAARNIAYFKNKKVLFETYSQQMAESVEQCQAKPNVCGMTVAFVLTGDNSE